MTQRFLVPFRDALAFLSRLAPPASRDGASLAAAVPCYPLAGLVLGFCACVPYLFISPASWVPAWLYALILAWLTRGLHWDGLADLADACGSNAHGERFWQIMKDSRIGAFGVMALVFGLLGQVIAARNCIAADRLPALIMAPAVGRAMVIALGMLTRPHPKATLGALVHPGTRTPLAALSLAATLAVSMAVTGFLPFLIAALLASAAMTALVRIAGKQGGCNGDFYGAAIICGETTLLFGVALV